MHRLGWPVFIPLLMVFYLMVARPVWQMQETQGRLELLSLQFDAINLSGSIWGYLTGTPGHGPGGVRASVWVA